ncbi:MAG TPA: hypothetical protein VL335_00335 [Candidatus Paceibacterota bacterium]|jgi:hypothetical protein|nr:hypothetical protein [Candidatus Paceibacterota bacterium]
MQEKKSPFILIITLILLVVLALVAFWYFFLNKPATSSTNNTDQADSGFSPFGRPGATQQGSGNTNTGNASAEPTEVTIPVLRLLSATPIGGYGASTTASTTVVRWIDRGRGNILEAYEDSLDIHTLSNTLLPRTYTTLWNKNLSGFIGSILGDDNDTISTVFATLVPHSTSTLTTPYELRGKNLPDGIVTFAASPKKDKVFFFIVKDGRGIGYVAPLAGGSAIQIFNTPVTELNAEWPEDNTIAITTKGTASQNGYLYFVNPKTGTWKRILGSAAGLSTTVSHDAKYVLVSTAGTSNNINTYIYNVASSTATNTVINTLADKCVWGNFYKDTVYCAVPFQPVSGTYPDDWYKGTLSTVDKIWQVNAQTGEVHLISSVFSEAKRSIDAFNLGLDDKDNFLFFMNKNDLSFWSYDLVAGTK